MYNSPDFFPGINSNVKRIDGSEPEPTFTSSDDGEVQNVGYNSHVLSPAGCTSMQSQTHGLVAPTEADHR